MALACAWSVGLRGVDGEVVEIEADLGQGLPGISLVGLPDTALAESRDRVRAAVVNSGETWPPQRITLALSPATLPKQGSGYDVALACCVLAAAGKLPVASLRGVVMVGELALDGRIRAVRGVLPALLSARRAGVARAVVPATAASEAALVEGVEVLGAECLADVLAWLRGQHDRLSGVAPTTPPDRRAAVPDLADVVGQEPARRAVEIAAAGGHHLLMMGPPGSGKTMLARRMVGLLPDLDAEAALEVAAVRSLAGATGTGAAPALPDAPPFVAPHHSLSPAALVGGGSGLARPGAVSLAHRGVLFLDEVLEFGPHVLELLRTPLEEGEVRLARKDGVVRYPARFQVVMAANPCPCAPARDEDCVCPSPNRRRYRARLSGPLLDRVDLRIPLLPVSTLNWAAREDGPDAPESTATVRARVLAARRIARERWAEAGWRTNAEVPGPDLRRYARLPLGARRLLDHELQSGAMTARGVDRALRVAWTVADLRGAPEPDVEAVCEALSFKRETA